MSEAVPPIADRFAEADELLRRLLTNADAPGIDRLGQLLDGLRRDAPRERLQDLVERTVLLLKQLIRPGDVVFRPAGTGPAVLADPTLAAVLAWSVRLSLWRP